MQLDDTRTDSTLEEAEKYERTPEPQETSSAEPEEACAKDEVDDIMWDYMGLGCDSFLQVNYAPCNRLITCNCPANYQRTVVANISGETERLDRAPASIGVAGMHAADAKIV